MATAVQQRKLRGSLVGLFATLPVLCYNKLKFITNGGIMSDTKKIALVLSGGGAKGYFQSQMWGRISEEFGITPSVIAGVSAGALNGALIAHDKTTEMLDVWGNIREKNVYRRRSLFEIAARYGLYKIGLGPPPLGAYDNTPLFDLIKKNVDYNKLKIPLKIGRVNLNSGQYKYFINDRNLHKQILASTAIPVVWSPVEITEEGKTDQWVDGGVRNVTPLGDVIKHKPDLILIVPTSPYDHDYKMKYGRQNDLVEVGLKALQIMMHEVFINDIDRFLDVNKLVAHIESSGGTATNRNGKILKSFDYLVLSPAEDLGDALDFSRETLEYRKEHADNLFDTIYKDQLREKLEGMVV
jgi:NTE family protein